ncbi:MAG: radical SAM protein [Candidatus Methanomethylophilaceae archaeon]|nr:radical SAM protein [Candidatus Methanomethylophilaceae archaeon]
MISPNFGDASTDTTKFVTLCLTHQCNLRCSYCYEHHKSGSSMSKELAMDIVRRELDNDDNLESVEFDFFGGEPLLQFNTIRYVVESLLKENHTKSFHFGASTNGTILDESMKEWLCDHKNIMTLGLSLDGRKESHDMNRSGSFDMIDLGFFASMYPDQPIKMTISRETLPSLSDDVIFCHEKGFRVACNLAYGIDWSDAKNMEIIERELRKLINYYLNNEIEPCSMLDYNRLINVLEDSSDFYRTCGAGRTMVAYDVDGSFYPCQHFLPLCIGEDKAKTSKKLIFKDPIDPSDLPDCCRGCILVNSCPSCYGSNYELTGDINKPEMDLCKLLKIEYKACAYFVSQLFDQGLLNMDDPATRQIVRGAIVVAKNL